jgi:hypothetical protein
MEMRRSNGCGQEDEQGAPAICSIRAAAYFLGVLTLSATSMCKAFSTMRGMFSANHWRSMGRSRSAVESSIGAEAWACASA